MSLETIMAEINSYIMAEFDIQDDPDYSVDINLFDYGYVDSLGATEIILYLEAHFNCVISQRDISLVPLNTVREMAQLIAEKNK